ncbi:MAG: replication-relaxation family protein [Solirubrobacteraceae bacterium]
MLNFVSECRLASGKQLVRRFWQTSDRDTAAARAGRRALKHLADNRVLDPLPSRTVGGLHGGSDTLVYGVGVAGVKLLARRGLTQKRLGTPGERYVKHTLAATELVVALHEASREGVLELIETQFEPACWRGFIGTGGSRIVLKPDLFVRVGAGSVSEDRWLIEVDLATEASATIRAKALRHLAFYRSASEPVHPRVLWAVPDVRRAEQIADVLRRLSAPADRLFAICLLDEAVSFLAAEAHS